MPRIAAFPKAYMQALCKDGTMKLSQWFELASTLEIQGLEFYAGFIEMADQKMWPVFRQQVESLAMTIPSHTARRTSLSPQGSHWAPSRATTATALNVTDTNAGNFGSRVPEGRYVYKFHVLQVGWTAAPHNGLCSVTTRTGSRLLQATTPLPTQ